MTDPTQNPAPSTGGTLQRLFNSLENIPGLSYLRHSGTPRTIGVVIGLILLFFWGLSIWWSFEPSPFHVETEARATAAERNHQLGEDIMPGYVTTHTLSKVADTLLHKNGGYLSNDILPPSVFMDNMPSWEYGALTQVRDFTKALRNDLSRSQTQSVEDKDLKLAEPKFNVDNKSWMFPSSEDAYGDGIHYLDSYLARLADDNKADAQFFARADNLRDWLKTVEKRLGSLSQRLSASVGPTRYNEDLAGEPDAQQARAADSQMKVKTPWLQIDDIFYEARGTAWVLIHLLRAVEIDFRPVLEKKNALPSLHQIIRELEATQGSIWSPMVMNGSEFGFFANHSLVMSSYISRATAAIIDLRDLLRQG